MNKIFDNGFDEELARMCIIELLPCFDRNIVVNKNISKFPDIIGDGIIIEVTRAQEKSEACLSYMFYKYHGCEIKDIPKNAVNKYDPQNKHFGFVSDENGVERLLYVSYDVKQLDYKLIEKRIIEKTKKLNKYYEHNAVASENVLFVFNTDSFFAEYWTNGLIDSVNENTSHFDFHFDYFIIKNSSDLYVVSTINKKCRRIKFDNSLNGKWRKMALINLDRYDDFLKEEELAKEQWTN